MFYYKLYLDTPIAGTDECGLIMCEHPTALTEKDKENYIQDLFDSYGYCINGYGEDISEEEEADFKDGCTVIFEEISEKTFDDLIEEGYDCIEWI